jgi:phosphoenolpyruvate-protein kinase (PTS system EI component)
MQLDEFSASPKLIQELKQMIRRLSLKEAAQISRNALRLNSTRDVREYLQNILEKEQSLA